MAKVTLDEIIDVFIFYKPQLFTKDIKDYIFEKRGKSIKGYDSKYSFEQTIQRVIGDHCPDASGYTGEKVFKKIGYGRYELYDHSFFAQERKGKDVKAILSLVINSEVEDLEITTRKLREVSVIQRNIKFVLGLKKLYEDRCQLCSKRLEISSNRYYSEVHHIKPLGLPHNGIDEISNMLVVCPNCHVLLDFAAMKIDKARITITGLHKIEDAYITYHNTRVKLL